VGAFDFESRKSQEKEVKQGVTTANANVNAAVDELKNWVEAKVNTWEGQKKSDALEEALQTGERLKVESNKLQSKLETLTHTVNQDLENLQVLFKESLQDQGAAFKGQMRQQMASITAEMRQQKTELEREKTVREAGYKHLMTVMEIKRKPAPLRQIKSECLASDPSVMDDVAARAAHLVQQLEAEVADRDAKMEVFQRCRPDGVRSVSHLLP